MPKSKQQRISEEAMAILTAVAFEHERRMRQGYAAIGAPERANTFTPEEFVMNTETVSNTIYDLCRQYLNEAGILIPFEAMAGCADERSEQREAVRAKCPDVKRPA